MQLGFRSGRRALAGLVLSLGALLGQVASGSVAGAQVASGQVAVPWSTVSAGFTFTCGVRVDHTLWCWGANYSGQLGSDQGSMIRSPLQTGTATDWESVTAGTFATCGLRAGGSLWCWGNARDGQLGLGDLDRSPAPSAVATGSRWRSVSLGLDHACGIGTDGSLWCWGANPSGQLGLGDTVSRRVPTRVGAASSWVDVSAGQAHTCARRADRTLWCWGSDTSGQLGRSGGDPTLPGRVGGAYWAGLSAGGNRTCALRTDHGLWCWGDNARGGLGLGPDVASVAVPTRVGTGRSWAQVSVGAKASSCGAQSDRTLWCWGDNEDGEVGVGDTVSRYVPTRVGPRAKWGTTAVSVGSYHSCAISPNRTLRCWGDNTSGELGFGVNDLRATLPYKVLT